MLINNGAAGMPNFRDTRYGVITRIGLQRASCVVPLYATRLDKVHIEALPLHYNHERWRRAFLANWPAATAAHRSYFERIERGPRYALCQVPRWHTMTDAEEPRSALREEITT